MNTIILILIVLNSLVVLVLAFKFGLWLGIKLADYLITKEKNKEYNFFNELIAIAVTVLFGALLFGVFL